MDPEDFNKLASRQGKLYSLLNNKDNYIREFIEKIDIEISEKEKYIEKYIEKIRIEYSKNIEELKIIYLTHIFKEISSYESNDFQEALNDFDDVISKGNIKYHYTDHYNRRREGNNSFNFSEIEKQVNPVLSYEERKRLIQNKQNNEVERIKDEIQKLQQQKIVIKSRSLKEIFEEVDINKYIFLSTEQEDNIVNSLLKNLITQGYINENYIDYISLFHEGTISPDDKVFEIKVKSRKISEFDYKIEKKEGLVKKIGEKYFGRKEIFNFNLLDFLIEKQPLYENKYRLFINSLCDESETSRKFIDEYIAQTKDKKTILTILLKEWPGLCKYIFEKSNYPINTKYELFEQILLCVKNIEEFLQIQGEGLIKK